MRRTLLILPLIIAACGTPQENCITQQTRDLRIVEQLVAETRLNLDRGYAVEDYTISVPDWGPCATQPPPRPNGKPRPVQMCMEDRDETRTRAVAIDLRAERAKLDSLLAKRDQLQTEAAPRIAQCQRDHPD